MNEQKDIYDAVYTENLSYNFHYPAKDFIVDLFAKEVSGKILDAGCGQGGNLRRLLAQGYDAFGVELSSVCCEKYLSDLPHANSDIIEFSLRGDNKFDAVICFDVLEHIPESLIDKNIEAISKLSDRALLGIANHSDIQCGEELHLIQENIEWWIARLEKYFTSVNPVVSFLEDAFFVIEVSKIKEARINSLSKEHCLAIEFSKEFDEQWQAATKVVQELDSAKKNIDDAIARNTSKDKLIANLQKENDDISIRYTALKNSILVKVYNYLRRMLGKRPL